ncbi:hypothetical protein GCM10022403_042130 [Streptomyces coacervatus]|uniref:Uncharacterized protein n=1 Tax=Streptomyces coacervatus TaxID=647381 RepID=A0ABP7I1A2_9ACTN|nr:hypothetical protein [Streptomyces coacervatus]MDF2267201.1 hypothetical protein [Streptomyces coacervatus]
MTALAPLVAVRGIEPTASAAVPADVRSTPDGVSEAAGPIGLLDVFCLGPLALRPELGQRDIRLAPLTEHTGSAR